MTPYSYGIHMAYETLAETLGWPYKVLQRSDKTFVLDINDGHDTVSITSLEASFLDAALEPTLPQTNGSTPTTIP